MKKLLLIGLLHLIMTFFLAGDAAAQAKTRVRFAPGASAATLKGKLKGYGYVDYVVRARAGQMLSAEVSGTNRFTQFVVFDANMDNLESGNGVADWSGELPGAGDYTIRVLFPRAEARRKSAFGNFTLKISVR